MRRVMLSVAFVTVLLATGSCRRTREVVFIDPALSVLVPNDTVWLAGVRLDKIKETPLYKRYLASRDLPGFDRFRRETGLDPRTDLWELLVAGNGKQSVLLVRGKFSPDLGSEPRLNLPNARRFSYKSYTLTGDDENAVTFMNSTVAVAGPTPLVKSIIDSRDVGSGAPKRLDALLKAVPKESQIWSVGDLGTELARVNPQEHGTVGNLAQFGRTIESGWLGTDLRSGLKLAATITCQSDQDAGRLNAAIRAVVGMGRLSTAPEDATLLGAWDAVHTNIEQNRVLKVNAELTEPQAEALVKAAQDKLGKLK